MSSVRGSMIIADDVRSEASGKLIIIGVYSQDIVIPLEQFIVAQLSVFYAVEGGQTERHPQSHLK